jgi:hypothetical protein
MAIDAAVDGQGVALARTAFAAWDLLAGRLVHLPFGPALPVPYAYWIVCPQATADLPKIAAFRAWLVGEAKEDAQRLRAGALIDRRYCAGARADQAQFLLGSRRSVPSPPRRRLAVSPAPSVGSHALVR